MTDNASIALVDRFVPGPDPQVGTVTVGDTGTGDPLDDLPAHAVAARAELTVPVAPAGTVTDLDRFTSPAGAFALPRYALDVERVGTTDEPRIVIVDRVGTDTLVLALVKEPGPASGPGTQELPHLLSVSLKLRVPVVDGGSVVTELPFPVVLLDAARSTVTAELPLTTIGLRQQLLAALSSLDASVTLLARREILVAVPAPAAPRVLSRAEVAMPALGEGNPAGVVTRWIHAVGEPVAEGEALLEVSTDKVDTEIPAPFSGTLLEITAGPDETVQVGARLGLIGVLGEPPDEPAHEVRSLRLDQVVPPTPLVLSAQHQARLGGAGTGVTPMTRIRIAHGDRTHSYWQDPARPERYLFLPDRFLLARDAAGSRAPLLRVFPVPAPGGADPGIGFEFSARPVVDAARLAAARPVLEQHTLDAGGTGPVRVEILSEAQPLLRLALPRDGAPSPDLTDRPATEIDLERGLVHAESMSVEDFRRVHAALFGASLSVLRGEVRVGTGGPDPEDVPLELRLDHTAGGVLLLTTTGPTPQGIPARVTNAVESAVRGGGPGRGRRRRHATDPAARRRPPGPPGRGRARRGDAAARHAPARIFSARIFSARIFSARIFSARSLDAVVLDETMVVVEPDREAIWDLVFDRTTDARLVREIRVLGVAQLFVDPARPDDRVAVFLVTVDGGGTPEITEAAPTGTVTARVPVEPLLTGRDTPPLRYRTETVWQSGGIGVSPWREATGSVLVPVRTVPA